MSQVTIKLDPAIEEHIGKAIENGEVRSSIAYVEEALADRYRRDLRSKLDAALDRGIADADAGRVQPLDEAFDRILTELAKK
jgi:antitoxin ParD1/3/4